MHGRKFPHTNVENKTTQEICEELEVTFIRPGNVTFDRYLVSTRKQQHGETMEQFHSAQRSLAEHCQLAHLEDELLRDIFTANMIDHEIQKELLKTTLTPEKTLELAVGIEPGIRSQLAIQSKQLLEVSQNAFTAHDKIVSEISSAVYHGSNRVPSTPRGSYRGNNKQTTNNNRSTPHNFRNCGQVWDMNHKAKCLARGKTCRRCNKPNHFAKVCKSNLIRQPSHRSINEVDNQRMELSDGINMIYLQAENHSTYGDSGDEYSVNMMDTTDDPITPSKLHRQYGHSKFWVMVDSGRSTSLVTEQMIKDIEARDSNPWWSRTTNPVKLKSYTNIPIKNLGTLYCDIECNGWRAGRADIIVVPNKHRVIVGRDFFKTLGIHRKKQDSSNAEAKNVNSIEKRQHA